MELQSAGGLAPGKLGRGRVGHRASIESWRIVNGHWEQSVLFAAQRAIKLHGETFIQSVHGMIRRGPSSLEKWGVNIGIVVDHNARRI